MGVGLVRMDANRRPDVGMGLGRGDDVIPLTLARRYVEEAGDAGGPGIGQHFVAALGQTLIIEVAMAVDQPHAASSSSASSSRGKIGCGWAIGAPPCPLSIRVSNLSADPGMIGATATVSMRMAATRVPSTSAIRCGSVLRSAQGAAASTKALQAKTAVIQASNPAEKAKRSNSSAKVAQACSTSFSNALSSSASPACGSTPSRFLKTIDKLRWAKLPK